MLKFVEKVWGYEEWLVNNDTYCAKHLVLKRGYQCSLHYHKIKDETFYILEGEVILELTRPSKIEAKTDEPVKIEYEPIRQLILKKGSQIRIHPLDVHRFKANTEFAKILEVSTTHMDADSYRIEKSRKI